MIASVGLVGLGNIGGGMCRRLLDKGIDVVGFDVSPAAAQAAAGCGAGVEPDLAGVTKRALVIVTSLPNPASVRQVYLGSGGSISGGRSAHFISGFANVIRGDFRPGFKTSLAWKDLQLILDLARDENYATRLAPAIAALYRDAVESGLGEDNFTCVVKRYEAMAGIQVIARSRT